MTTLTTAQMTALQDKLTNNDVAGFYSLLQSYGDPYGRLGLGVTNNDTWQGQLANGFAENGASQSNLDMTYGSALWTTVNKELASRYLELYTNNAGVSPSWNNIQLIHNDVYDSHSIPRDAWFPNMMLNDSSDPAALWSDYMVNTGAADIWEDSFGVIQASLHITYDAGSGTILPRPTSENMEFVENFSHALLNLTPAARDQMANDLGPVGTFVNSFVDLGSDYVWFVENPGAVVDELLGEIQAEIRPLADWYNTMHVFFNVDTRNMWDPLVIDLDGDGVNADISSDRVVYFDLDADGLAEATNWISADDGILVRDVNGNGKIDDGSEVFGNATTNGFAMLAALDSNSDGQITAADSAFSSLKIWQDLNQNGISEAGELTLLPDAGIVSMDVSNYQMATVTSNGITHTGTATTSDERQIEVANVAFRPDVQNTHYMKDFDLDLRALFLPTLRGYGKISDLHVALSLDNGAATDSLMSQALHLVSYGANDAFANWATVKDEFREFLFSWSGVDAIDPSSRGQYVDARELTFVEYYMGDNFVSQNFDSTGTVSDPGSRQGTTIHEIFEQIGDRLLGNFFGQTAMMQIFDQSGSYSLQSDDINITSTLNLSSDKLDELSQYASGLTDTEARIDFWVGVADFIESIEITSAKHISSGDEILLDTAIHSSDSLLWWYAENHDVINGITSIEYRYQNPLGEEISGTSSDDSSLAGTSFDDTMSGLAGTDSIHGGAGNDWIYGHDAQGISDDAANDDLYGDDGDDMLFGGDGNDTLTGGLGDDTLIGGNGDDVLSEIGSRIVAEQNYMEGGAGNDTYFLGGDRNVSYILDTSGTDTLNIAYAYDMTYVTLSRIGDTALRLYSTTLNQSESANVFLIDQLSQSGADAGIEYIKFYTGQTIDFKSYLSSYTAQINTYGSDGNDVIHGITIGDPDDYILAGAGDDIVYGDDGADLIFGGDGNDEIHGGIGNDQLYGESGESLIYGDDGNDTITLVSGVAYGGEGNDNLVSSGESSLYGDGGDDYISFSGSPVGGTAFGGDGNDNLIGGVGNDILAGGAGDDNLNGGNGLDTASYIDALNGVTVDLSLGYADALNMGHDVFTSIENLSGSAFADILAGNNTANIISGSDGDDLIDGKEHNDVLYGDGGNDALLGGSGRDILYGGLGNDQLDGGTGDDTFHGDEGSDTALYNSNSSNFIIWRDHNDYLTIMNTGNTSSTGYGTDKIYNDVETITFSDMVLDLKDGSLDVIGDLWGFTTINGTAGSDTIYGFLGRDIIYGGSGSDTVYAHEQDDRIFGGDGTDFLYGEDGNDTISGDGGNDVIFGDAGDDILEGGIGTDQLHGGDGADTAIYDIGSAGFIIYRNNANYLTVQDTANTTTSGYGFDKIYDDVEFIQFQDVTLDLSQMTFLINENSWGNPVPIYGTATGEYISDTRGNDTIYGDAGNDTITATYGDDSLYGGSGNDTLKGGIGNDTFYEGAGTDFIYGESGIDTVIYETGSAGFIIYRDNAGYLTVKDTNDTSGTGYGSDRLYNDIEYVQFNDATLDLTTMSFSIGQVGWGNAAPIYGTSAGNTITGYQADDLIYGYEGADIISGGIGSDTIYGGDGNDYLYGYKSSGSGDDNTSDILYGEAGNDIINGNGGDDLLIGGDGSDTIYGGAGADTFKFTVVDATKDTIGDFNLSQGDKLDISEILIGYDPLTSAITDFIEITTAGSSSVVKVDRDGAESSYSLQQVALISNVTGLTDEQSLLNSGAIIA